MLISFDKFIEKWLGNEADYDGWWDGQCVDLYRFYVKEVLGFEQSVPVGGATEIWATASKDLYDFFGNKPNNVPENGDIVIFDRGVGGGFGHVSIFIEGDVMNFISLDQNFPTLSVVTKTKHNYNNVIGWLRPKNNKKETMTLLHEYLGVKNDTEAKTKLNKHLGEDKKGNSDWGNAQNGSGFLGQARRALKMANYGVRSISEALGLEEVSSFDDILLAIKSLRDQSKSQKVKSRNDENGVPIVNKDYYIDSYIIKKKE